MKKMNSIEQIENYLDELFPNPKCELNYNKDYELLLAVMLSAQTTDKSVNMATKILFNKYKTLEELKNADIEDIKTIIKPVGTYNRKSLYLKKISTILVDKYNSKVPNDRKILESLPGVGRKSTNVVLSNIYNVPAIAVDTHVSRVSKRLKLAKPNDDVGTIEKKLMKKLDKSVWSRRHHQLVLFGRYHCTAMKPKCKDCKLKEICINNK